MTLKFRGIRSEVVVSLFDIGSAVCGVIQSKVYHEHLRDVVAWVIESSARLADAPPPGEDHHSPDHHQVILTNI